MKHFKVITVVLTFVLTMYIQHLNNTREIEDLINKCELLDAKIADQYERIDAIKLDKAVFEATITQFTSIQNDLTRFVKTFVRSWNTTPYAVNNYD